MSGTAKSPTVIDRDRFVLDRIEEKTERWAREYAIAFYREELQAAHAREKETLAVDYANSLEEMDSSFANELVVLEAAHAREVEGLNKRVSELEAECAYTILDATNRLVDARSDLMSEVERLRAALEKAGNILCGLGHDRSWVDAALAASGSGEVKG